MKRFLAVLLLAFMVLTFTAFAADDYVGSPNDEPSTDDMVDVPGDDDGTQPGDDSPQTGFLPITAIAGAAALGVGCVGAVAFRKKNG